jgi:hypothetical protein
MLPKPDGNGTNHLFASNSLKNNACATALRNVQGMARLAQASRRSAIAAPSALRSRPRGVASIGMLARLTKSRGADLHRRKLLTLTGKR